MAAAMLAGCSGGGSQSGISPSGVNPAQLSTRMQSRLATLATLIGMSNAIHPYHGKSWFSPDKDKKKKDFMYVSDSGNEVVDIYTFQKGKAGRSPTGTLSGFDEPQGECTNGKDIWITNTEQSDILEYKVGDKSPIATLSDSGQYPVGCSYDKTTGNLAVSSILSTSDTQGNLAIYAGASGTPTAYTCSNIFHYYFVGYDDSGNVYVDGQTDDHFSFCDLTKGSKTMTDVTLNQSITFPGGVQWDGKYVAVGDQQASVIYQFTIKKSTGTEEGRTAFTGASDIIQFWIDGSTVIAPDAGKASVELFPYPAGGLPTQTITGFSYPVGSTVAKGK